MLKYNLGWVEGGLKFCVDVCLFLGGGLIMLNGCGERKANIDLGTGDGSDYDLPDQTNTLDVYCIGCLALRSHIQSANYTHSAEK